MKNNIGNKGFTLIELAIVIVIIGLLLGGVLQGQELITQTKIRSQVKQIQSIESAFLTFKSKYNCVPGDCINGVQFFSGTTNGNGNGELDNNTGTYYDLNGDWSLSPEYYNFFVQLTTSKLLSGNYGNLQILGSGGIPVLAGNNGAGIFAAASSNIYSPWPDARNPSLNSYVSGKNALFLVACGNLSDTMNSWDDGCGVFTQSFTYQLDLKIDDGSPLSGNFLGFGGYNSNNDCLDVSSYKLTKDTKECQSIYIFDR